MIPSFLRQSQIVPVMLAASAFYFCASVASSQDRPAATSAAKQRADVLEAVQRGDNAAILELGKLGDTSAIPLLTKLAEGPDTGFRGAAANARMALARLGDRKEFDGIVKEAHSDDPAVQYHAIGKLEYVASPAAMEALIGLLDDMTFRTSKDYKPNERGQMPQDKVIFVSPSYAAMQALARIAPSPPVPPGTEPQPEHVPLWRKWWAQTGSKLR
jgi:HEAT repeat protein